MYQKTVHCFLHLSAMAGCVHSSTPFSPIDVCIIGMGEEGWAGTDRSAS